MRLALVGAGVIALGIAFGWSLLVVVAALAVSIFLHELGHYLVAKAAGMKVTEFFLGFGPRLWSFQRGETTYGLKLVPAGAYVRIIGMSNLDSVDPADEDRTYRSKPYRWRLATILAGPFANFTVAFVLLFGTLVAFGQTSDEAWVVGRVVPGSAAEALGLQPGDEIVSVDGVDIGGWDSFGAAVAGSGGLPSEVTYERDGELVVASATLGWRLTARAAAALPPLQAGDTVVSVDGVAISSYTQLAEALSAADGETASLVLDRPSGAATSRFTTELAVPSEVPAEGSSGFVGIGPNRPYERVDALRAVPEAAVSFGEVTAASVGGLVSFFSPSGLSSYVGLLADSAGGPDAVDPAPSAGELRPVEGSGEQPRAPAAPSGSANEERVVSIFGVLQLGSQAAESHPAALLWLVVIVNIFLGLFNLLPVPPLDGGHAAVATWEALRERVTGKRHRVDMARLMPITYVMVFLLLGLGMTSVYLDVTNPVPSPFGP